MDSEAAVTIFMASKHPTFHQVLQSRLFVEQSQKLDYTIQSFLTELKKEHLKSRQPPHSVSVWVLTTRGVWAPVKLSSMPLSTADRREELLSQRLLTRESMTEAPVWQEPSVQATYTGSLGNLPLIFGRSTQLDRH